jgi:DNA-binding beta-propeller fold protein YncE
MRSHLYAVFGAITAAVLLAACGMGVRAVPTTSGPTGRFVTSPADERLSHDKSGSLLYVTDWYPTGCNPSGQHCKQYGEVYVYDARLNNPPPLATITDRVNTPTVACLDSKGVLYVANSHADPLPKHGWISEYLPGQTKPSLIIRKGINIAYGCAIDANDNLLVSNAGGINITEYKPGKTEPTVILNAKNGLFAPAPIALDSSGNLYVINNNYAGHANVQIFAPGAKQPTTTITNGAWWPQGIAVDANGTLYISNFPTSSRRGAVTEFHSGQTAPFLTILDDSWEPWGLTVNRRGRLFVSDSQNSQQSIIEFAPGSSQPSKKTITGGLVLPAGIAYWPAVLP